MTANRKQQNMQEDDTSSPLNDHNIGLEARMVSDDHLALRVWLRLLSCTTQIETEVRKRLRAHSGISLARFDYLAQLQRHPSGLKMGTISRYLMVTGGNVTGLTNELETEGLISRSIDADDRRSCFVRLTPKGSRMFKKITAAHEAWIIEMFSDLGITQQEQLHSLLGTLRQQLAYSLQPHSDEKDVR